MDDLVVVRKYLARFEAEVGREVLQAEGIEAIVAADDGGGWLAPFVFGSRTIHLLVPSPSAGKAKRILGQYDSRSGFDPDKEEAGLAAQAEHGDESTEDREEEPREAPPEKNPDPRIGLIVIAIVLFFTVILFARSCAAGNL